MTPSSSCVSTTRSQRMSGTYVVIFCAGRITCKGVNRLGLVRIGGMTRCVLASGVLAAMLNNHWVLVTDHRVC